ncbi:type II toxin-antitoxin system RelE/ParE family toxin [Streptomyces sp. NBC_00890]|nr:type II toxin-antitoxin system RelE/ParE family toxin [Streptomyces sp. NBC_00891]WSY09897.1 type II toxin-antitoxin system RelE/ParE family toxin [Streptomyces sp. NBC_00890]WSZ11518.1 type II toxin-antitoxin system RelE/ParE family toxin [Streptomyces sp. NBC_00869]WSZ27496.1 type II toxin-antitoxin system RelE/ParE family toxin [Streptomyces sp. NBC_00870]
MLLEPVETWFLKLCEGDPESANRITEAFQAREGSNLGRPMVDRIHGSRLHRLKELRPGSSGQTEMRMLFVFDHEREAVIPVAGDKSGRWSDWYRESIPVAELRYAEFLASRERGGAR